VTVPRPVSEGARAEPRACGRQSPGRAGGWHRLRPAEPDAAADHQSARRDARARGPGGTRWHASSVRQLSRRTERRGLSNPWALDSAGRPFARLGRAATPGAVRKGQSHPQLTLIFAGEKAGICWGWILPACCKINGLGGLSTGLSWDKLIASTNTLSLSQHSPVFPARRPPASVASVEEGS
jgi:hypothetical protein